LWRGDTPIFHPHVNRTIVKLRDLSSADLSERASNLQPGLVATIAASHCTLV
jgi:hypothetical protein